MLLMMRVRHHTHIASYYAAKLVSGISVALKLKVVYVFSKINFAESKCLFIEPMAKSV